MAENIKQMYTKQGYQELVDELKYLKLTRREEIKEQIAVARGFGDLSENSEYDEARNEQAKNEARIKELEELLENAVILDESTVDTSVVSLLAGIAGLAAGMAIASKPERDAVRRLKMDDVIDSEDAELMDRNISEVLGVAADRGKVSREHLQHIEVDEETSIEDFIFDA